MMLIVASCAEAIVKTVNNIQLPKHSSNNLEKEDMNPIATSSGLLTNATSVAPYLMRKSLRNDRADGTYSLIVASSNATVKLVTEAESKTGGKTKEGVEKRRSVIQIPLERYVNKERYHEILQGLKMRQQAMSLSLMEQAEVPLEQEILTEKHIATYYGRLKIGNTVFKVLFDTGSCEFWVPSSVCTTPRCKRHTRFPEEESVLDIATDQPMSIEYLSGKVLGKMVYETVQIGDLPIPNQVVGLADTVDIELMDDVIWDGILGLAYPNPQLSARGVLPLFDNIVNSKALESKGLANQFAYYIDDREGSVTLGGANCDLITPPGAPKEACIEQFMFVPVTEKTYWTITLDDVSVKYPGQPEKSGFCHPNGCKAIVDTGTYLIYGPQNQVNSMVRTTSLKTCDHHVIMPEVTFTFRVGEGEEPVSMTLKPIDYILKFEISGNEDCVVGISPDKDTIWTLGQVFLRSFYTLFDRDEDRIGFARLPRDSFKALNVQEMRNKEVFVERGYED